MSALSHVPMPAWTGTKGSCFGLFARDEPDEAASRLEAKLCAYLGRLKAILCWRERQWNHGMGIIDIIDRYDSIYIYTDITYE